MVVAIKMVKTMGSPHLITAFTLKFLGMMYHEFESWNEGTGGGPWIHALLLQFLDCIGA